MGADAQVFWDGTTSLAATQLGGNTVPSGVSLEISGGSYHDFNATTITNHGTVNWLTGYLRSGNGGAFINHGTFNDRNASGYSIHNPSFGGTAGTFSFINHGTYTRDVGGTTYLDTPFDNHGAVNLQQGDLQLRAGGTMSATSVVNAAAGTTLYFTNNYTLQTGAQFTGAGAVIQSAGTLTLNGTLTAVAFGWQGGNWNAADNSGLTTTIGAGTVLNLGSAHDSYRDFNGRTLVNQGTVNWDSAYLRSGNGGALINHGTFNDRNASGYSIHNPSFGGTAGTFSFINHGTYTRDVGGTTYLDIPFVNAGTLTVSGGELSFGGDFTNAGGTLVLSSGGFINFAEPLDLGAGTLAGTGTITAPEITTAGLVSPGNSPGFLSIVGDLTLQSTARLQIQLGGTTPGIGHDVLAVNGLANLGGSLLQLDFIADFESSVSPADTFTILSATALTGAFSGAASGSRIFTSDGLGSFLVNYGDSSPFAINSVVLSQFVAIPEPGAWQLLVLGLAVLALCSRRLGRH